MVCVWPRCSTPASTCGRPAASPPGPWPVSPRCRNGMRTGCAWSSSARPRDRAPAVWPGPVSRSRRRWGAGLVAAVLGGLDHAGHAARGVIDADELVVAGRRYREGEAAGGLRGPGAGRSVGRERPGVEQVLGVELLGRRARRGLLGGRGLRVLDRGLLV